MYLYISVYIQHIHPYIYLHTCITQVEPQNGGKPAELLQVLTGDVHGGADQGRAAAVTHPLHQLHVRLALLRVGAPAWIAIMIFMIDR